MVFGALDVGSVVGLLVSGPLIRRFGWSSVFYFFAVLGLVWSALWPLLKPSEADKTQPAPPKPSATAASAPPPPYSVGYPTLVLNLACCKSGEAKGLSSIQSSRSQLGTIFEKEL